jgi:hypothetical protein
VASTPHVPKRSPIHGWWAGIAAGVAILAAGMFLYEHGVPGIHSPATTQPEKRIQESPALVSHSEEAPSSKAMAADAWGQTRWGEGIWQ